MSASLLLEMFQQQTLTPSGHGPLWQPPDWIPKVAGWLVSPQVYDALHRAAVDGDLTNKPANPMFTWKIIVQKMLPEWTAIPFDKDRNLLTFHPGVVVPNESEERDGK